MSTTSASAPEAVPLARLIRTQAAAEADAILARAREQVAQIRAASAEAVARTEAAARESGAERGRREAARILAEAQAEAQRRYLLARERLITEAIDRARERLAVFATRPDAAAFLERLIAEGLAALPPGPVRVSLPRQYAGLLGPDVLARLGGDRLDVRLEDDFPPGGGVVLETPDGRLRFDNSFEGRIRRRLDRIRLAVARARHLVDDGRAASVPDGSWQQRTNPAEA